MTPFETSEPGSQAKPGSSHRRSDAHPSFSVATLLVGLLAALPIPVFATPPLRLSLAPDAVVVRGLEPGAEVVYFSVARAVAAFVPRTERRSDLVRDNDLDGEVRIPLEEAAPVKFLAVAVELGSGRFGVLTPEGSPAREVAFPADAFGQGPGRRYDRFEDHGDYLETLLVRPGLPADGAGAWTSTSGDGTPTDAGPASDGRVMTAASDMEPVGTSGPPPAEVERNDLLVRVAPRAGMEYYVVRIVR